MNTTDILNIVKETATKTVSKQKVNTLINDCIIESKLKKELTPLVLEALKEIKDEKTNPVDDDMEEIDKVVKSHNKDSGVIKNDAGNYEIDGNPNYKFDIRPKTNGIYDVIYFKDKSDREKKLNLNAEELKAYIQEKLKSKDLNYVYKAQNKSASNDIDQTTKVPGGIETKQNPIKKIGDTKNDYKDYTEQDVKNDDDLPTKDMKTVDKYKKTSDYSLKGSLPDYIYPKQKDKKLVVKQKSKGKGLKKLG